MMSGLWWQVYRIASLIVSYILAVRFYFIGYWLFEYVFVEKTAKVAGCILVFIVVFAITYFFGKFIRTALGTRPGVFGHMFGGMLGLLKGALICSVFAYCLLEYNLAGQREELKRNPLTSSFARGGKIIASIVPEHLRTSFEAFVKETSEKTKKVAEELPKIKEMVEEFKESYTAEDKEAVDEDKGEVEEEIHEETAEE